MNFSSILSTFVSLVVFSMMVVAAPTGEVTHTEVARSPEPTAVDYAFFKYGSSS
ncbi:hypothetical protein D9619_010490 [Psilocybe cf. subviscida]|uniref:Uncharacterized protein n=1 Tax=Psilocybe cf. subviscida TaxID=2480587 RepID=A0A8H5ASV0_9AGAR|nr:hypothetical protein D9619_010490 [Psilocybe cf. subviscida]